MPPHVPSILTAYEHEASVTRLTDLILQHDPVCIVTHDLAVTSMEHLATVLLAVSSFWRAADQGFGGALLQGREDDLVFGELDARWDAFVNITDTLDQKMQPMGCHACQMPTAHYPNHGHRLAAALARDARLRPGGLHLESGADDAQRRRVRGDPEP